MAILYCFLLFSSLLFFSSFSLGILIFLSMFVFMPSDILRWLPPSLSLILRLPSLLESLQMRCAARARADIRGCTVRCAMMAFIA